MVNIPCGSYYFAVQVFGNENFHQKRRYICWKNEDAISGQGLTFVMIQICLTFRDFDLVNRCSGIYDVMVNRIYHRITRFINYFNIIV